MKIRWFCLLALLANAFHGGPALGDQPDTDRFAHRMIEVMELVLDHQIEPPTKQAMLLEGTKAVYRASDQSFSAPKLSRQISSISHADELQMFLAELSHTTLKLGQWTSSQLEEQMIEGMLSVLSPGSQNREFVVRRYVAAEEHRVNQSLEENRYVGIGIVMSRHDETETPIIRDTFARGPAHKAGALPNDEILEIDGAQTQGLGLQKVVNMLRGPEGTSLNVLVRHQDSDELETLYMTRSVVPRETVVGFRQLSKGHWDFAPDPARPISYIRVNEISDSTLSELRLIERQIQKSGAKALVLDLRSSGQGRLHPTVLLGDGLLGSGAVGTVHSNQGKTQFTANRDCLFRGWPLAVLVNELTTREFEWLAAALQDNDRATLVGEPTGGNWWIEEAIPLPEKRDAIRLTTGRFQRPDPTRNHQLRPDRHTQERSRHQSPDRMVIPDHSAEFDIDRLIKLRAKSQSVNADTSYLKADPQLEKAMKILTEGP